MVMIRGFGAFGLAGLDEDGRDPADGEAAMDIELEAAMAEWVRFVGVIGAGGEEASCRASRFLSMLVARSSPSSSSSASPVKSYGLLSLPRPGGGAI